MPARDAAIYGAAARRRADGAAAQSQRQDRPENAGRRVCGAVPGGGRVTSANPPLHPAIAAFPIRHGCLEVGGIPLTRLAERVGQTPFFAYDRRLLSERIGHLRRHLPPSVALHYAIKANPMPAVVQHLAGLVDGFDVASVAEMKTALDTPMAAGRVSFAGPGKTAQEIDQAIAADITIELESVTEMARVAASAERSGRRPRVALRVNLDFVGFHIFGGSQNLRGDILQAAQERIVGLAISLAQHALAPVRHLNIGGGFGIPYFA